MDHPPTLRVSTLDREAAVDRLKTAFLEGRLTDVELAQRIDGALASRIGADLEPLLSDLPSGPGTQPPSQGPGLPSPAPLRFVVTHKGSAVQGGRWTVPARFKGVAYKGHQVLDLTRAVLTGPRTDLRITAYKSTVEVIVPRGLAVEVRGTSYAGTWTDTTGGGDPGGPLLVVKGFAYKGSVTVRWEGPLAHPGSPSAPPPSDPTKTHR